MAKKVLIIGDTIIDKSVYLEAIGLSLESPTIKTSFLKEKINFGGAANVARYASYFGLDVTFATCMSEESEKSFPDTIELINLDNTIENTKTRFYVNHGDENYKYLQINNTNKNKIGSNFQIEMNEYDIVAFSDYRCGLVTEKMISDSKMSSAKTFGASQVSSQKSNFHIYQGLDFLVCNKHEASTFSRKENVIITNGAHGCELNGVNYNSSKATKVARTIGAGDCFYAAYLAYEDPVRANESALKYVQGKISI